MLWSILDEHTERAGGSGRHGDVADKSTGRDGVAAAFVVTTMAPTSASNAANEPAGRGVEQHGQQRMWCHGGSR
ncbi:hypothetical protein [Jiangella rhizosphaerae]|uniref:Uncharacterized protein n=1 Tax=Jiangella rhizosphaerae TaxID=2293569 RepID=A0A418KHJ8_9ACTN|nr:hypothetical protein [Jiangella rhizosphaerae]RIQ11375.1 hypothetical protein DY240_28970 [Jiangella rhizosphaerae]